MADYGHVEDDGDGGLYIAARAVARIKIAKSEFVKTHNSYPTAMHAFVYITSMYGDIFDVDNSFINYEGVDVIFDPVGGELFEESSRALSRYGKILVIGFASGKIPK